MMSAPIPVRYVFHAEFRLRDEQERGVRAWAERMERLRASLGARPGTIHVTAPRWVDHYAAGEDPAGAVVEELLRVAD